MRQKLSSSCKASYLPLFIISVDASVFVATDRSVPPLVGLTAQGQLLWGRQLIAKDITSFVVRSLNGIQLESRLNINIHIFLSSP